jgi:hypothetical protein
MTIPNIVNLATKPRWCLNMLRTQRRTFRSAALCGQLRVLGIEDPLQDQLAAPAVADALDVVPVEASSRRWATGSRC